MADSTLSEDQDLVDSAQSCSSSPPTPSNRNSIKTTREYYHPRIRQNNGNFIRARLLNRLGIVQVQVKSTVCEKKLVTESPKQATKHINHLETRDNNASSRLDRSRSRDMNNSPRRYTCRLQDNITMKKSLSVLESINSIGMVSSRIKFNEVVNVVEIPGRHSYCAAEHDVIWCNAQELLVMSRRNEKEFFYEKYIWQNAIEEHDFVDLGDGVFVHPAHVPSGYMERKRNAQNRIALMNMKNPVLEITDRKLLSNSVLEVSVGS